MEQEPFEDGSGECQYQGQGPCVSFEGKKESETEGFDMFFFT